MKNPYEVLGVPESATDDQIKSAYRALAKKYHPDNYADSPLADVANEKMQEINEAYDAITSGSYSKQRASSSESYGYDGGYYYNNYSADSNNPLYSQIRMLIKRRRYDEAESMLNGVAYNERNAEWNYLKGQVFYNKGWFEKASGYFETACKMDPENREYQQAYNSIRSSRSGGFRTRRADSESTDGLCNMCSGLLCADCCCECMGGDLIPCC